MAEWRIGRGWSTRELQARLEALPALDRNFSVPVDRMTSENGWHRYFSESVVVRTRPGPPAGDGPFTRGRIAVANYAFSDPRVVIAHFDPAVPLQRRHLLLELRALRVLHYLGGVAVGDVVDTRTDDETVFGFRYDTLEGHIERGVEWFLLTKEHATGKIRFRIEAAWQPGDFPNWWSRAGFSWLGEPYQERWHRKAHRIMAGLVRDPQVGPPAPDEAGLVHADPEVVFTRFDTRTTRHEARNA